MWGFFGLFMNRMNDQSVQMLDEGLASRKVHRLIDVLDNDCLGDETPFSLFKYTSYILPADGKHCWFSKATSLSHHDCHHYLLCKPNNRQLSNSTYGCPVIKEAEKLLIFQAQL